MASRAHELLLEGLTKVQQINELLDRMTTQGRYTELQDVRNKIIAELIRMVEQDTEEEIDG